MQSGGAANSDNKPIGLKHKLYRETMVTPVDSNDCHYETEIEGKVEGAGGLSTLIETAK